MTAIHSEQLSLGFHKQQNKQNRQNQNNEIKIKNSLSVAANDLSECLQRKSGKVSSAVSKTTDQSDFECFRKSDISKRIERTLAVGMKCDKLAEKYNSLLKMNKTAYVKLRCTFSLRRISKKTDEHLQNYMH